MVESDVVKDDVQTRDNLVLPFQTEATGARGRLVRLGSVVDTILKRHDYPDPVSILLGEAVALTGLIGASLKFEGNFILQTETDGPVDLLVVDYQTPGELRAYARFDADRVVALGPDEQRTPGRLLGQGHLAMTIDQGPETERYQGIVPVEGGDLNAAADLYFQQSEQLPTFIRVAVARHYLAGREVNAERWTWRAGGLMLQKLTDEGGHQGAGGPPELDLEADDDDWNRVNILAATVQDHELLDPMLAPERLLFRLFHEESVRAYRESRLDVYCRCSEERIERLLDTFAEDDLSDMVEGGQIIVTCEFCKKRYSFDADAYTLRA